MTTKTTSTSTNSKRRNVQREHLPHHGVEDTVAGRGDRAAPADSWTHEKFLAACLYSVRSPLRVPRRRGPHPHRAVPVAQVP